MAGGKFVAKHLRLSPRQHDLWVLAHVADRDDDERRERADDDLRGAGEQYRPGGGDLDRPHPPGLWCTR